MSNIIKFTPPVRSLNFSVALKKFLDEHNWALGLEPDDIHVIEFVLEVTFSLINQEDDTPHRPILDMATKLMEIYGGES